VLDIDYYAASVRDSRPTFSHGSLSGLTTDYSTSVVGERVVNEQVALLQK